MKHRPRKRFGQNFLHDEQVISRIARLINPRPGEHILEIGPGQGALTAELLEAGARVTAVEIDRDLARVLEQRWGQHAGFTLFTGDILKQDLAHLCGDEPARLVGNLPYNISTPVLFHALDHRQHVADMLFMLQKEVVTRMAAAPGSKAYGRLSVMTQYFCEVAPEFVVKPGAFFPPPKVDSQLVRLKPWKELPVSADSETCFAETVRIAFSQRRKTLRNTLRKLLTAEQIEEAGADPAQRAETLDIAQFVALSNAVKTLRS